MRYNHAALFAGVAAAVPELTASCSGTAAELAARRRRSRQPAGQPAAGARRHRRHGAPSWSPGTRQATSRCVPTTATSIVEGMRPGAAAARAAPVQL
ncbi:hypothetical protein HBB16_01850 [Pseudonocardia sp. MCCB 268]|nr:hypothetical protein [Pseudonocardia cytotoxica]